MRGYSLPADVYSNKFYSQLDQTIVTRNGRKQIKIACARSSDCDVTSSPVSHYITKR